MEFEKDLNIDPFASTDAVSNNLSAFDGDEAEDSTVLEGFNIPEEKEFPHIKLNSRDFLNALGTCGTVLEKMSTDSIFKTVMIQVDGKNCNFKVIGPVSKLHYHCGIMNTNDDLILTDTLFINHDLLTKVCKVLGSSIYIIKKDDGIYLRLVGGDLKVETEEHNVERFELPDGALTEILNVETGRFGAMLSNFESLVNAAIKSSDKRIFLHNNGVYFNDLSTWTKAEFEGINNDLILRGVDIKVLRKLIDTSTSQTVVFNKVDNKFNYVLVNTTNCTFAFIADSNIFDTNFLDGANLESCAANGVDVEAKLLKNYATLSTVLPNASEYLTLLVSDEKFFSVVEQKTTGLSKFALDITSNNKSLDMKTPARVNSRKLDLLLAALNCTGSVRVYMSEDNNFVYVCKVPTDTKVKNAVYSLIMKA